MAEQNEKEDLLLGFLGLYGTLTPGGYIGAILITDQFGKPREFRCTHVVRPTAIQKPLYGKTLEPYIGVELCGTPLIEATTNKPALIMVDKDFLIDIRIKSEYPLIYIRRAGEAVEVRSSTGEDTASIRERVDSATGRFQPIVFEAHQRFDDDRLCAKRILDEVFKDIDPLEPFERMGKAIEVLARQDSKFQ
jgi:hypothetical protein